MRAWVLGLSFILLVGSCAYAQEGGRYRYSDAMRSDIAALGSTIVSEVPVPVVGISLSELTKNFGDPRSDGRTHEGLDIIAPHSTPVASPTNAVVTSTGNGASSGIYVRTANPGGETFVYMHLSKISSGIERGKVLKRGDIIGYVGNTGNASGGGAHLHFEIRKNGAQDPFPRLTSVFTADEQTNIIRAAQQEGVSISAPQTQNGNAVLSLGSSGTDVVALQKFLIAKKTGTAASRLAAAGATGYFGAITEAALREYQTHASLTVNGSVDREAYELIIGLAEEGNNDETEEGEEAVATSNFTRDLERGMRGEDVRALQVFLNTHGFRVAESGDGSPGNETTFFGPATQSALIKFQTAKGVTPAAGYFGPKTRAVVAQL